MDFRKAYRFVALVSTLFLAVGCPIALDDDFKVRPEGNAGENGSGGASTDGGAGGSSGLVGTGGRNTQAGGAGSNGGATATGGADASTGSGGEITGTGGADGTGGSITVPPDGGDAQPPDPCSRCTQDEECCDGQCVDVQLDAKNCRSCGIGCPGTSCFNASCTNACLLGFVDCNKNLVDGCEVNAALDPENCGNCGIKCAFQQECVGGNCVCPAGRADCDDVKANGCETDVATSKTNCGTCGKACGANQECVGGGCACAAGFADCNKIATDGCEASLTDPATCGSCALDCGPHATCVSAGKCGCEPGQLDCDANAPGCETAATDPAHCGTCTTVCGAPTPACNGTQCINGCGALTTCGASCVDVQTDPLNCGGCGKPVGQNQTCVAGKPTCVTGFANCDANPNDCEVDTRSDPLHCGSCPGACKPGAVCTDSACACAPGTPNDCGASCQQCCNDGQCSDGDSCTGDSCVGGLCKFGLTCAGGGNCCAGSGCFACCSDLDCTGGKICSGNQCVTPACATPQILCNTKCVNPTNDAANCGSCGNACGAGRTCTDSACTPKWVVTAAPPAAFVARQFSAYTAIGSKVFVWGGLDANSTDLATGAIYDPVTNAWTAVSATGAPTARVLATAVWTGSVVVVWGGGDGSSTTDYATGGRYDPATNTWKPMSTASAPSGRRAPYGVWTGSRVLFYGGFDKQGRPITGTSLYDPVNDVWSSGSQSNAPTAASHLAVGCSGSSFFVFGGFTNSGKSSAAGAYYTPSTNAWTTMSAGPTARYGAFGAWDGSSFLAWGGATPVLADGKSYDVTGDRWTALQATGAPSARWAPQRATGWTARLSPGVTLMLGGLGSVNTTYFTDGAVYNSTTNAWTPVASWPSGTSHVYGVGVWTGSEFFVWGGRSTSTGTTLTSAGERYLP